jgi:hypothetical protein
MGIQWSFSLIFSTKEVTFSLQRTHLSASAGMLLFLNGDGLEEAWKSQAGRQANLR